MEIINILVVDDDEEVIATLSTILEDEGYFVESAKNCRQAIEISKKTFSDIALIDIELPDMKGTELISKLREIQPKIACIMITGHPSIENAVKAVNEQADGYILKPFDVPKLLETVKIILKRKKDSYFQMFQEVERASKNTPIFKYQHPDKW